MLALTPAHPEFYLVAALGLLAGVIGGLLGTGGSLIMIPGLVLLFGQDGKLGFNNQHVYQASAMIANVAVSVPAALRHRKAGAIVPEALRWILPAALLCVLAGVWMSNRSFFEGPAGGVWLGRILALFVAYVIYVNVQRLRGKSVWIERDDARVTRPRALGVGAAMGSVAGLLGVGGGAISVPLQQVLLGLPLKKCIGNSSAIICLSASLGAIYKNATLGVHGFTWQNSLTLAALLVPTAWLGGHLGASLTHRLPVKQVRIALVLILAVAAVRMAAIPWGELWP